MSHDHGEAMSDMREHFNNDGMPADWQPLPARDIHTCSYSCTRPPCVLAQRDELRAEIERLRANGGAKMERINALGVQCDRLRAALVKARDRLDGPGTAAHIIAVAKQQIDAALAGGAEPERTGYMCHVPGCRANHVSKREVCTTVPAPASRSHDAATVESFVADPVYAANYFADAAATGDVAELRHALDRAATTVLAMTQDARDAVQLAAPATASVPWQPISTARDGVQGVFWVRRKRADEIPWTNTSGDPIEPLNIPPGPFYGYSRFWGSMFTADWWLPVTPPKATVQTEARRDEA